MQWTNDELAAALSQYERECQASGMRPISVHSYVNYAQMFLRWRLGEYQPRGSSPSERSKSAVAVGLQDLFRDLQDYEANLRSAPLQEQAVNTYLTHAAQFVRWLGGKF